MRIDQILARLRRLVPREPAARALHRAADRELMGALVAEGIDGADRLVAGLNSKGHRFVLRERAQDRRMWVEELDGGKRAFEIRAVANRFNRLAAVRYVAMQRSDLTPRQRKIHAIQQRFYERYMAIGQRAYRNPPGKLAPIERRLLLVGELEADVNNGGFSQYLGNKGLPRARATLRALRAIGATKAARLLEAALAPGASEAELRALDSRFGRLREDLATLAARHAHLDAGI